MKNILKRDTTVVSLIAALVIFLSYKAPIIQNFITNSGFFGSVILPSAIFVSIFNILLWFYREILWLRIHSNDCFDGTWIYKLHNSNKDQWLYGYFKIKHNWNNISIPIGRVWYWEENSSDNHLRGTWSSSHIIVSAERMLIMFDMMSGPAANKNADTESNYKGIIEMSIEGSPPQNLDGRFRDLDERSDHNGSINCVKISKELNPNELQKIIHSAFGVNVK